QQLGVTLDDCVEVRARDLLLALDDPADRHRQRAAGLAKGTDRRKPDADLGLVVGSTARIEPAGWERMGLSPTFAYALNRAHAETDLRPIMPAVRAPTLVLYRHGSPTEEQALEVAARIEGARAVRVSGNDFAFIFQS